MEVNACPCPGRSSLPAGRWDGKGAEPDLQSQTYRRWSPSARSSLTTAKQAWRGATHRDGRRPAAEIGTAAAAAAGRAGRGSRRRPPARAPRRATRAPGGGGARPTCCSPRARATEVAVAVCCSWSVSSAMPALGAPASRHFIGSRQAPSFSRSASHQRVRGMRV